MDTAEEDVLAYMAFPAQHRAKLHRRMGLTRLLLRLFQGIENEPSMRRGADAPTHDPSGIGVDDEGDLDEPLP